MSTNSTNLREGNFSQIKKQLVLLASIVTAGVLLVSCSGGGGGSSGMGSTSMNNMAASGSAPADPPAQDAAILNRLSSITTIASTVPADGDVNPYGVASVQRSIGKLKAGSILVSNFNGSANLQGTGTTIVQVARDGTVSLFAQIDKSTLPGACPGGVGLTTALVELSAGWVIVGSLPTADGTSATAQAGCLIVLDSMGHPVETISGPPINGPWDMTAWEKDSQAKLFVTNVLNDTVAESPSIVNEGTVVRIDLDTSTMGMPTVESMTIIGSGFAERTDPAALVIGPTGVGLGRVTGGMAGSLPALANGAIVLYVADSLNNSIVAIPDPLDRTTSADTGSVLSSGGSLNDPLGLTVTPNGHILTVNGNDGFITEITPAGTQIATKLLDNTGSPPGAGTLFGLIFDPSMGVVFVDDGSNTLNSLH